MTAGNLPDTLERIKGGLTEVFGKRKQTIGIRDSWSKLHHRKTTDRRRDLTVPRKFDWAYIFLDLEGDLSLTL